MDSIRRWLSSRQSVRRVVAAIRGHHRGGPDRGRRSTRLHSALARHQRWADSGLDYLARAFTLPGKPLIRDAVKPHHHHADHDPPRPDHSGITVSSRSADSQQLPLAYMSCRLGADHYGVDVRHVRSVLSSRERVRFSSGESIRETQKFNPMAVPILDLRTGSNGAGGAGTIIVVEAAGHAAGLVFDAALDVMPLASAQFSRSTESTDAIDQQNILGRTVARINGRNRVVVLLDVERLLADSDAEAPVGFLNSRW